jgi:four helix bundle protein
MDGIQSFRDLDAWKVAMDLADCCYSVAKRLPTEERFGLGAQLRRACVSVPSNIAEGFTSGADGVFGRHLAIALGSIGEVDTILELIRRNRLAAAEHVLATQELLSRTRQLVFGLRRSVKARLLKRSAKATATCLALAFLASKLIGL